MADYELRRCEHCKYPLIMTITDVTMDDQIIFACKNCEYKDFMTIEEYHNYTKILGMIAYSHEKTKIVLRFLPSKDEKG